MTTTTAAPTAPVSAAATIHAGGSSRFSAEQIAALSAPLERAKVHQREQGRGTVSYVEGWQVIAEANRIFGFDGWQRQTLQLRCIHQGERLIGNRGNGREPKPGWGVTYTARVRITVGTPGSTAVIREGCGAGHGIDVDLGQAHESALKEAETDAMKRALMTFGNPFGLALYDKRQREVTSSAALERPKPHPRQAQPAPLHQERPSTAAEPPAQPAAPASQQDPGLLPLDAATIRTLHNAIRQLHPPLLDALTQGFRKRFSIPEEATTIADRIVQKRHHDWIESFLVSHREVCSAAQHQAGHQSG